MVWINGAVEPAEMALLAVTDRGFQLGDGVFETVRVVAGRVLELSLHVNRLRASAAVLDITVPEDLECRLQDAIAQLLVTNGPHGTSGQAAVRATLSRGPVDGRALLPPESIEPTLVVQLWPVDPIAPELLERGLNLVIADVRRDPASPLARVKTTSRAEFVYARIEAARRGADEAVFLTTDGNLAEATSASLFLLEPAGLATPSLECGILVSTTREWVISKGAPGLAVREARLTEEDLFAAEEAFLASSVAGIVPVTRAEGRDIGSGRPGARTMALRALRENAVWQAPS
jgi:branched-chain amino acid aminotransferase